MIPLSNSAKNVISQNVSVSYNTGCYLEYNMNSLIDNVTVTGVDVTKTDAAGNTYTPFKKLFPVDSIIKPFRPNGSGIQYAIAGNVSGVWKDPKATNYTPQYRLYYPGEDTYYKYYLSGLGVGVDATITYPKTIYTNKIIFRLELSHSTPANWTLYTTGNVQLVTGTSADIVPFTTDDKVNYNSGTVTVYYNGTGWSTTKPSTPAAPVALTSLRLATTGVSGKYVGLIELSPRWYMDVSDRIVSLTVNKESSTTTDGILPVGNISANSMTLSLVSFENNRTMVTYDKTQNLDVSKIYLYKQVQLTPYIKLYNPDGAKTDSSGKYDEVIQGTFFADTWDISEYGEVSVNALDGAKILQETIAPGILCEGYSITAIIRRLLDSVGFTSYKINTKSTDASIFAPRYWWTDNTKTVWDCLQELCRDAQITAVFSYDNVLNFYTREYMFDAAKGSNWDFRSEASGADLSNILSFSKTELPSANQVKVLWNSVATSNYTGSSQKLWESRPYFLAAFALNNDITEAQGAGTYMNLSPVVVNEQEQGISAYDFNGYLIINSEIIEYDAVEYQYVDKDKVTQYAWIENRTDLLKYLGLAIDSSSNNYKPSGKYRIKTRGAFSTKVKAHPANAQSVIDSWQGYGVTWK